MQSDRFIVAETACKLASRYVEKGQYMGTMDRETGLEIAEWYMQRMGILTFGVESITCEGTDRSMDYINTGETYDTTVVLYEDEFWPQSWGGWYEEMEQEYCEENNKIRCAYCSALNDCEVPNENWHLIVCESCGHYVDGGDVPVTPAAEESDDDSTSLEDCDE